MCIQMAILFGFLSEAWPKSMKTLLKKICAKRFNTPHLSIRGKQMKKEKNVDHMIYFDHV